MIHGVILAAGRSRRMGTPKLLLPIRGQPLIARIVEELGRAPLERLWVVVGQDGRHIREALAGRNVQFVTNPDPEGDMLSSVRCGVRALPDPWDAVLVVPADHPTLSSGVVSSLLRAFVAARGGIVVPSCCGRPGHPILAARRYREEILERHDATGLRGLLQAHPTEIAKVEVDDAGVLEDMDWPEDYARISRRLEAQDDRRKTSSGQSLKP